MARLAAAAVAIKAGAVRVGRRVPCPQPRPGAGLLRLAPARPERLGLAAAVALPARRTRRIDTGQARVPAVAHGLCSLRRLALAAGAVRRQGAYELFGGVFAGSTARLRRVLDARNSRPAGAALPGRGYFAWLEAQGFSEAPPVLPCSRPCSLAAAGRSQRWPRAVVNAYPFELADPPGRLLRHRDTRGAARLFDPAVAHRRLRDHWCSVPSRDGDWRSHDRRMGFVRFTGLSGCTPDLLRADRAGRRRLRGGAPGPGGLRRHRLLDAGRFIGLWLVPCGAAGAAVVAAWLAESRAGVCLERIAPLVLTTNVVHATMFAGAAVETIAGSSDQAVAPDRQAA